MASERRPIIRLFCTLCGAQNTDAPNRYERETVLKWPVDLLPKKFANRKRCGSCGADDFYVHRLGCLVETAK